jgi:hypothetical protein
MTKDRNDESGLFHYLTDANEDNRKITITASTQGVPVTASSEILLTPSSGSQPFIYLRTTDNVIKEDTSSIGL